MRSSDKALKRVCDAVIMRCSIQADSTVSLLCEGITHLPAAIGKQIGHKYYQQLTQVSFFYQYDR